MAMSGGVDSSVVAALLAREGYDVVGLTMQLYDHGAAVHRKGACCAGQDIHDARDVAAQARRSPLRARLRGAVPRKGHRAVRARLCRRRDADPLRRLQPAHEIRRPVRGRADLGADLLATGHYVVSRDDGEGGRALYRAADPERDQSYFLFATTRGAVAAPALSARRPAEAGGARAGARVRACRSPTRPTARTSASCRRGHYSAMIERLMPGAAEPGDIVHVDGRVLGRHNGILHYTIGQRRGLGVAAGEPLYVVALDAARTRVVVGPREALATPFVQSARLQLDRARAARGHPAQGPEGRRARALDPAAGAGAICSPTAMSPSREPESGVSPGQACVLYDSTDPRARVLGGGFIAASAQV